MDDQENTLPFLEHTRASDSADGSPQPTLTLLAHPDPGRVGERMVLMPQREELVSRVDGRFAQPRMSRPTGRALDTRWLSRTPLRFMSQRGQVHLTFDPARTVVEHDGRPTPSPALFDDEALGRGVVLLINRVVALLLHRAPTRPRAPDCGAALVGESEAIERLRRQIAAVAAGELPVLIRGETGTGKELVARAVHEMGPRAGRPFVAVNLGAVPAELGASTLFGHEAGAFSGASRASEGAFRAAAGGTLFLDEIGEASPAVQTALLRALESREIQPVGRARPLTVDVRVIAATDADLEAAVSAGRFRAALLERLGLVELRPPPLRQRRDDIGRLLFHFLRTALGDDPSGLLQPVGREKRPWPPADVVAQMTRYGWRGNVRQLRNLAFEMATLSASRPFQAGPRLGDLLARVQVDAAGAAAASSPASAEPDASVGGSIDEPASVSESPSVDPEDLDEAQVRAILSAHKFRISAAARALGLSQGGMYGVLRRLGIRIAGDLEREEFATELAAAGGDMREMGRRLQMSTRALALRRRALGLSPE